MFILQLLNFVCIGRVGYLVMFGRIINLSIFAVMGLIA